MGKLREKLKRVNAPRPTALPDGSTSMSADAVEEHAIALPAAFEAEPEDEPSRPTDAPAPLPPRSFAMPVPAPASADPTVNVPRFKGAFDRVTSQEKRSLGGQAGARSGAVFRSRDFERWRKHRSTPGLVAVRESEAEAPPLEPLSLERTAGLPTSPVDMLRAARLELSRNRTEAAIEWLQAALDGEPEIDTRRNATRLLAELYVDTGYEERAIPLLKELVVGRQGDPYPLIVLADLLAEQEPEHAAELRGRAREIAPWLSLAPPEDSP